MGSYNSINFTKLIVNSIPYNKAYMGSKILFENNNPFTLEITGYKDGNSRAQLCYRKGTNDQENATFHITCGNKTYTRYSKSSYPDYLKDNNENVYFKVGDKIKIKVVYDNNDTPVISARTDGAGIVLLGCYYKVYGDLTTFNANGYCASLFRKTSLTPGDELTDISGIIWPETVSRYCYYQMFYGCTSLTHPVDLPATTLVYRCYTNMFGGTGITDITMHALDYSPLDSVTAEPGGFNQFLMTNTQPTNGGVFRLPVGNNLGQFQYIEGKAPNAEEQKWTIQEIQVEPPLQTNPITVTSLAADNRIYFKCLSAIGTVKYNDNTAYQTLSEGDEITLGTIGNQETLQVKYAYTGTVSLMGTGDFTVSGDIIDVNDGVTPGMFKNSTHLTSAKNLVLSPTTLTDSCYKEMFMGCTSLVRLGMPDLNATVLADNCYDSMFKGCTSLQSASFIYSRDIVWADECCNQMFMNCTGISYGQVSPKTVSNWYAYNSDYDYMFYEMFKGCTSMGALYFWGDPDSFSQVSGIIEGCAVSGTIYLDDDNESGSIFRSQYINPNGWSIEYDSDEF